MKSKVPSVAIFYKNFAATKGISHIGLGVSASLNAKVLTANVAPAVVIPSRHNIDIVAGIAAHNKSHEFPITHAIISAPWLSIRDLRAMAEFYKDIQFLVVSHSNVGFLQADPNGTRLLREGLALSKELPNFKIGGNCRKFTEWMQIAYGVPVVLLPNMYPSEGVIKHWDGSNPIRIGIFGAIRPQKNVLTAVAAAIAIGRILGRSVELYTSSGREEGGVGTLLNAMNQLTINVPNFTMIKAPWRPWSAFREVVGSMDLLIQTSYTESFNMVTADGVSMGVPSVTSEAITWVPKQWQANSDNALDVARVGIRLLTNNRIREKGFQALDIHNKVALDCWREYITGKKVNWFVKLLHRLGL